MGLGESCEAAARAAAAAVAAEAERAKYAHGAVMLLVGVVLGWVLAEARRRGNCVIFARTPVKKGGATGHPPSLSKG